MSEPDLNDNVSRFRYLTQEDLATAKSWLGMGTALWEPMPGSAYPSGPAWWEGNGDCIEGPADPEWDDEGIDALIRAAGA